MKSAQLIAVCCFLLQPVFGQDLGELVRSHGFKGGIAVHLGCGDGDKTVDLLVNDRCLVHGLDRNTDNVKRARDYISSKQLYGRVSVMTLTGSRLPYADNVVNLLIAQKLDGIGIDEIMRVLVPNGTVLIRRGQKWSKTVKKVPPEIDEWRQYLHDADNNAVAHDSVVGPPRHLQWVDEPAWSRSHMAIPTVVSMVSSNGRLFTIEDRATPEHPFLPGRWSLIARDAFNGLELWRHDFPDWEPVTRYVKDMAVQLQRRLAAIGDTVYCTPGLNAPVRAFDAATGKVIRTYKETRLTQEFAYDRGILFVVVGDRMNAARYNIVKPEPWRGVNLGGSDPNAPFGGTGFRGAYTRESHDKADPVCSIIAINANSGDKLWRIESIHSYTGCSLAIKGRHAVYQTSGGLFCIDPKTGKKIWSVEKQIEGGDGTEANAVVLADSVVYAQQGKTFGAYSLEDGSEQWRAPIANNYEKAADLYVAAGAVWTGGSKQPTSYDIETGQKLTTIRQRMKGPMSHDRCYRNFITNRFYINSKTGGADFLDLATHKEFPNHWTRGTCGMGVLPCNGLLYAPPYSCQCSIGAMVNNFNAFATEKTLKSSDQAIEVRRNPRLVKGPAYDQVDNSQLKIVNPEDWPTYRHDGRRSGVTSVTVPARVSPLWNIKFRTTPSAPIAAGGKIFVSDVDTHTVHALNASDGTKVWSYVAGGRVDSPPAYYQGTVVFGSRDGWVHCVRASDGALVWRFKDLPDRLIGAFGQLESAWPVFGSVLVRDDKIYFAAGRSSFLDGGIFLYALDARTGRLEHSRQVYGPFADETGLPATQNKGFKNDIFVTDGRRLYLRHKAFSTDLTDTEGGPHVLPSAGFLDGSPQHRTYWTIPHNGGFRGKTKVRPPSGDILVVDGKNYYEVRGFPVHRHSYFDPRIKGYRLVAGTLRDANPAEEKVEKRQRRRTKSTSNTKSAERWSTNIPITGKAMVLAGDVLFIAGTRAYFPPRNPVAKYEQAYEGKLGGVLWAASAKDGSKLAEYKLDAAPVWDSLAAADGRLYICTADGRIICFGESR